MLGSIQAGSQLPLCGDSELSPSFLSLPRVRFLRSLRLSGIAADWVIPQILLVLPVGMGIG
eukprot:1516248-Rhodomonas_salina.1